MTTRRDMIKLASALGIADALPSTAERVAAVQLLDQEVSANTLLDPGGFATRVDGILGGQMDDEWLRAINPVEHAAYVQARNRLQEAVTVTDTEEGRRYYGDYEAAFFDFVMGACSAGIRHGAAYENLRRSVIGEVVQCKNCWGVGATKHRGLCGSCGGTGTVALKA